MPDLTFSTGVNLTGLRTGLKTTRTLINSFRTSSFGPSGTLALTIRLRYTGPSAAMLASITAALTALRGAAGSVNTSLGSLGGVGGLFAGVGLTAGAAGLYEAAKAAEAARLAELGLERQVNRRGLSMEAASKAVKALQDDLKISSTSASGAISDMLKAGATIEQALLFARAGAASALGVGRDAAVGIENLTSALITGQSDLLNGIGISQNLSTYMDKVARSVGTTAEKLDDLGKVKAMEQLVNDAVVASGELELLPAYMEGLAGKAGDAKTAFAELKSTVGKEFVAGFSQGFERAGTVLAAITKTAPAVVKSLSNITLGAGVFTVIAFGAPLAAAGVAAFGAAMTAASALILANPWAAIAASIAIAVNLAGQYYDKIAAEGIKPVEELQKARSEARDRTAGTEDDDAAGKLGVRILALKEQAAQAREEFENLAMFFSLGLADRGQLDEAEAKLRGFQTAAKVAEAGLKLLQDRASDKAALPGFASQLDEISKTLANDALKGLAKDLDSIKNKFDALEASAKSTFKDPAQQASQIVKINALRDIANAQASADELEKANKSLADDARKTEKARIDAMEDGLSKRKSLRELEVSEVKSKTDDLIETYALFPEKRVEFEAQAAAEIRRIRTEGAAADAAYVAEIVGSIEDEAAKALVGLRTGAEGILATRDLDITGINKREGKDISKVAGDAAAVARIQAAAAQLRSARAQEARTDLADEAKDAREKAEADAKQAADEAKAAADKAREAVDAARQRAAQIRAAELDGITETMRLRESARTAAYDAEIRAAGDNARELLAVESRFAQAREQAGASRLAAEYNARRTARYNALRDELADPTLTRSDSSALVKIYESDIRNFAAEYGQALRDAGTAIQTGLDDAAKSAAEAMQRENTALQDLNRARLQYAVTASTTYAEARAAQDAVLNGLREELISRKKIAETLRSQGGEKAIEANKAVLDARLALLAAERDARAERLQVAADEVASLRTAAEFARDMTVNAQEREQITDRIRASLGDEAALVLKAAAGAKSEQERLPLLQRADDLQRQIATSIEASRKTRLGELDAIRDTVEAELEAAVTAARTADERRAARGARAADLASEQRFLSQQISLYQEQGRSEAEVGALKTQRRENEAAIAGLVKSQVDDEAELKTAAEARVKTADDLRLKVLEVRDAYQALTTRTGAQEQAAAVQEIADAFGALSAAAQKANAMIKPLNGSVALAEDKTSKYSDALDTQIQAIQRAGRALASLKTLWDEQKRSVDSLNGSLTTLAGAAGNQDVLDKARGLADAQYRASVKQAAEIGVSQGFGSPEYVAAMEKTTRLYGLLEQTTRAAAENETRGVEASRSRITDQEDSLDLYREQGEAEQKYRAARGLTWEQEDKRRAEVIATQLRDAAAAGLGDGSALLTGLDLGAQNAARLDAQLQSAQSRFSEMASGSTILDFTVTEKVNEQLRTAAEIFATTTISLLTQWQQTYLRAEGRAPGTTAASAPSVVNQQSYVIQIGESSTAAGPEAARLARELCNAVSRQKNQKSNAKGG